MQHRDVLREDQDEQVGHRRLPVGLGEALGVLQHLDQAIADVEHVVVDGEPGEAQRGGGDDQALGLEEAEPGAVALDELLATLSDDRPRIIALQPISQKEDATRLCIDTCIARNWRLSMQTHKYLNIA